MAGTPVIRTAAGTVPPAVAVMPAVEPPVLPIIRNGVSHHASRYRYKGSTFRRDDFHRATGGIVHGATTCAGTQGQDRCCHQNTETSFHDAHWTGRGPEVFRETPKSPESGVQDCR